MSILVFYRAEAWKGLLFSAQVAELRLEPGSPDPPHRAPPLATLAGMELFSIPDFCLPRCVQVGGQKFQRDVGMG